MFGAGGCRWGCVKKQLARPPFPAPTAKGGLAQVLVRGSWQRPESWPLGIQTCMSSWFAVLYVMFILVQFLI